MPPALIAVQNVQHPNILLISVPSTSSSSLPPTPNPPRMLREDTILVCYRVLCNRSGAEAPNM